MKFLAIPQKTHSTAIGLLLACYWPAIGLLLACYWPLHNMLSTCSIAASPPELSLFTQIHTKRMDQYVNHATTHQLPTLISISLILGLGKGGVPGLATIATAATVLTAPENVVGGLGEFGSFRSSSCHVMASSPALEAECGWLREKSSRCVGTWLVQ
jgi:hypothetical protein